MQNIVFKGLSFGILQINCSLQLVLNIFTASHLIGESVGGMKHMEQIRMFPTKAPTPMLREFSLVREEELQIYMSEIYLKLHDQGQVGKVKDLSNWVRSLTPHYGSAIPPRVLLEHRVRTSNPPAKKKTWERHYIVIVVVAIKQIFSEFKPIKSTNFFVLISIGFLIFVLEAISLSLSR